MRKKLEMIWAMRLRSQIRAKLNGKPSESIADALSESCDAVTYLVDEIEQLKALKRINEKEARILTKHGLGYIAYHTDIAIPHVPKWIARNILKIATKMLAGKIMGDSK